MSRSPYNDRLERDARARRKAVGRILRASRKGLKLRQAWVGGALGYGEQSQGEISRIESGKRKIDVIELENFARLYGLRLSDFGTWDRQQGVYKSQLVHSQSHGLGPGSGEGLDEDEFQKRVDELRLKSGKKKVGRIKR